LMAPHYPDRRRGQPKDHHHVPRAILSASNTR
jgi:hypothetical protein